MALVIYPADEYDSFCSVVDADAVIGNYLTANNATNWNDLSPTDKESLLRQSTLIIESKIDELPENMENNLKTATAYLAFYSIGKDMIDGGQSGNVKRKEIVDVVETEYFNPTKSQNDLPDIVATLLKKYEYKAGGFSFVRA